MQVLVMNKREKRTSNWDRNVEVGCIGVILFSGLVCLIFNIVSTIFVK